jgi:hypothetical protein
VSIESIYIGGFTHKERTTNIGIWTEVVWLRGHVSLISYPYGDLSAVYLGTVVLRIKKELPVSGLYHVWSRGHHMALRH